MWIRRLEVQEWQQKQMTRRRRLVREKLRPAVALAFPYVAACLMWATAMLTWGTLIAFTFGTAVTLIWGSNPGLVARLRVRLLLT